MNPDRAALLLADDRNSDSRPLTYGQLNRRANQLARYLSRLGAGPERVVAVYLERSVDAIVAILAIFKARSICLPLDTAYPGERVAFMLSDARAAVIVSQATVAAALPRADGRVILLDRESDQIEREIENDPELSSAPDNGAYIIYTSGSTGKPKGVLVENQALALHCVDSQKVYGLGPGDRVLQFNSLSFDAAFEQIFSTLISGAALVLRGPEIWTARQFSQQIQDWKLTVVDLPTAYWRQVLIEWDNDPALQPDNGPRLWIVGGEAMSSDSLELWRKLPLQETRLINAYGPTEATITATAFEITPAFLAHELPRRVPIGRPRSGRTAYLLDEQGRPVPIGLPGELHLGGPLLARGYVERAEATTREVHP